MLTRILLARAAPAQAGRRGDILIATGHNCLALKEFCEVATMFDRYLDDFSGLLYQSKRDVSTERGQTPLKDRLKQVESPRRWGLTPTLLITACVLMFELSVAPTRAHAQVEEVKITVEGMTCNLCAAGLERSLRRVDGVAAVKVVLASQTATIRFKPRVPVAPARIRAGVEDAGQRLRIVELRIRGALQREDSRYQLLAAGQTQAFAVRDDARLAALAGKNVRVRARVVSADAAPIELQLIDIQPS